MILLALSLTGCSRGAETADTTLPADRSPVEVVTALLTAVQEGRFEDTGHLTDTTQAALLTLIEGADATEVAGAIEGGPDQVGANFWSGFAQTFDESIEPDQMTFEAAQPVSQGDSRFVEVSVTPPDGPPSVFVVRRNGSWKIDLFATFGPVLAERLIPRVETILSSADSDASTVLSGLERTADSLRLAAADPTLPSATHQALLALIERVTRTGG